MKHVLGLALVAAACLSGCETTQLNDAASKVPVESRTPVAASTLSGGAAATSGVTTVDLDSRQAGAGAGAAGATAAAGMPAQRIIYFDFDSFAIKDDYKPVIDSYGRLLSAQRGTRIVVEGHTDERGGREYNLALGQKRAEAVVRSLKLLGANDGQLEAVSFGKERPAATGNDEAAWAKNRRAELKER